MTDKLLPCPFCGGEAELRNAHKESWYVLCVGDECPVLPDSTFKKTKAEAVAAWNTRAERTCRMEYIEKASGDEIYPTEAYTCSLCRCVTLDGKPSYCPNCCAKVIKG